MNELKKYGIGSTPMKTFRHRGNEFSFKLEQYNHTGSVKARTAYFMICRNDDLPAGRVQICESTSGNLGLALHTFCEEKGHDFLCLIDESLPMHKQERLRKSGVNCEVVRTFEGMDGRQSRIHRAQQLQQQGYYWTNQYDSVKAIQAHYESTGPEIWEQTDGRITHLVCAVGTGGTIVGTAKYLKEQNRHIQVIGAEPFGSTIFGTIQAPYLSVGAGMAGKPGNILRNLEWLDDWAVIKDSDSINACQQLHEMFGLEVGITSGMAFHAALERIPANSGAQVVIICPDGSDCYGEYL